MAATNSDICFGSDTICALSSGRPPAAIAIVRLSGPRAGDILAAIAGTLPVPRHASLRDLRDADGELLDRALVLWFPGPETATGEDLAEFHLHGGRAVIEAVLTTLASAGCRTAEPGEFTRRALLNGRIDLGEAEGLADLLSAETDRQRKEALLRSQGALGRQLGDWTRRLVDIAAEIEAAIDYDGEEDVAGGTVAIDLVSLRTDVARALAVPPAERLREGIRIAIIGPPNEGKSSLFNAIIGMDAAIVTDIAGTTRDLVERSVAIGGVPFQFVDTAGLRDSDDPVERIGIDRARLAATSADIALLLEPGLIDTDAEIVRVTTKVDVRSARPDSIGTSALTGEGIAELRNAIVTRAERLLPGEGEIALDRRHRDGLSAVLVEIDQAIAAADPLIVAEHMRIARVCLDRVAGHAGLDDMLDALFERFCLGK